MEIVEHFAIRGGFLIREIRLPGGGVQIRLICDFPQ